MSPQAYRYRRLWKRLKQKYFPKPSIFIIHGRYQVQHESGYDWVIGYREWDVAAEEIAEVLRSELREARKKLGALHGAERHAWKAYQDYEFKQIRDSGDFDDYIKNYEERAKARDADPEYQRLQEAWHQASNAVRDKIDEIMPTMTDQDIPFPYSHIIERSGFDGPIEYYVEEVIFA